MPTGPVSTAQIVKADLRRWWASAVGQIGRRATSARQPCLSGTVVKAGAGKSVRWALVQPIPEPKNAQHGRENHADRDHARHLLSQRRHPYPSGE